MNKNVSSSKQVRELTRQIQSLNKEIPLFVAADQEGGSVKRIAWDTTAGQKSWKTLSDEALCQLGKERSQLLLDLGINMNFSPVVDLSNPKQAFINNRTISEDPKIVSQKTSIYIECSEKTSMISTLKHFPGHGPTQLDSHYYLPYVTKSYDEWLASDALPFKNNLSAKQIMVGHLVYTSIDKDNPSTLSDKFITEILRNDWGYDGLIITDDMNMLHTSTKISVVDALKRSINAGNNLIIYVGAPVSFEKVKAELVTLIETGEINSETIGSSIFRVLKSKRDLKF